MVWCTSISKAIFSLVPTPSTLDTRIGSTHFCFVDGEQAAKAADFAQHAAGKGLVGQILDPLLGAIGAVNIYTGIGVGDSALRGIVGHGSQWVSVKWGICQVANRASRDCSTVAEE